MTLFLKSDADRICTGLLLEYSPVTTAGMLQAAAPRSVPRNRIAFLNLVLLFPSGLSQGEETASAVVERLYANHKLTFKALQRALGRHTNEVQRKQMALI
mmetsp:Transcript_37202/g.73199  ORF Transcript_37202/g.73199 Transcript_37202/m.73199 type:complete len:100 (-) Transcript_37202:2-301(-)